MADYTFSNKLLAGANGWELVCGRTSIFTTERSCMTAPATFELPGGKSVSPYFVSPWQTENKSMMPQESCLYMLRGEFLCLPFGGNAEPVNGEQHPCHGEAATNCWHLDGVRETADGAEVTYSLQMKIRPGKITKKIAVKQNETVLYLSDKITGAKDKMSAGHHPIIPMPEIGEKMYLSLGKFDYGETCPGIFSDPRNQEYQFLASGEPFTEIEKLPSAFKKPAAADYSEYPSPYGFTDIFTVFKKPSELPAWSAAVYPSRGYLWFVLKDPAVLPATNIWVSNSGRFSHPWSGRTRCIGVEDSCSYFAAGLKASVENNHLAAMGYPTAIDLGKEPEIRMIEGVAEIPEGFGKVKDVKFEKDGIRFADGSGRTAFTAVDYMFVMGK